MTINYLLFYLYVFGAVIAFIFGCVEAYIETKENKDISEFPIGITVITFMSWFYVYHFIRTRVL